MLALVFKKEKEESGGRGKEKGGREGRQERMFVETRLQRETYGYVLVWPTQCPEKFQGSCLHGERKIFYVNI